MPHLTKQERLVLICLSLIIFMGSGLQYALKKHPQLGRIVEFIEGDQAFLKVDLNTATREELMEIPYIGKTRAEQILQYRRRHGDFKKIDHLQEVKGIGPATYKKIAPFIKIHTGFYK